ncbi:MAG TPA: hypothetical protein VKX28_18360 [Xanthobacteraceae bacterium]|nr:hypothetical protein [Xanthobacteraceae bacterium]
MTPNGGFAVGLILIALSVIEPGPRGAAVLVALALAFAAIEVRGASLIALKRATIVVLPLALFMGVVWVGIVGEAPYQIADDAGGTRAAALLYVAKLSGRLFFIVAVIQLVFLRFADLTPLQLVRALALPAAIKRMLAITLSLIGTLSHAIDRAHIALIASGTLTRAPSLRNAVHSWRLIQAVWLSAVTIMLGRMRDKWPVENTMARLDTALDGGDARVFAGDDRIWLPITLGAAAVILLADVLGKP